MNIPDSFSLKRFYNLIILISGVVFFGTLFGFTGDIVPKIPTILISLGTLIVGIGEMINHAPETHLAKEYGVVFQGVKYTRQIRPLGVLMYIIGFILVCIGIYKILFN